MTGRDRGNNENRELRMTGKERVKWRMTGKDKSIFSLITEILLTMLMYNALTNKCNIWFDNVATAW